MNSCLYKGEAFVSVFLSYLQWCIIFTEKVVEFQLKNVKCCFAVAAGVKNYSTGIAVSGLFAVADVVDESHEESEAEEAAGGEDEEQHTVGSAYEVLAEEAASSEGFANNTEEGECPGESKSDKETVEE